MIRNIGVLTSSRADYGILKPLITLIENDERFKLTLIVFGMHLEKKFGLTINEIKEHTKSEIKQVKCMPESDNKFDISYGYGEILKKFSSFWENNIFDYVISIGDRFEMSAAIQSSIPFEIKIVHIHGGETSLGSIDNIYRHQITLASSMHFTSNEIHSKRVSEIIGSNSKKKIFNIGSLSLVNLTSLNIPDWKSVAKKNNLPDANYILTTFHSETVDSEMNKLHVKTVKECLEFLSKYSNVICTSSNADTYGDLYNEMFKKISLVNQKIFFTKSLGKLNYFSALKSCLFVMGNSSSGIIEAASFKKYALNIGKRQLGRVKNKNVIDVDFNFNSIADKSIRLLNSQNIYNGKNIYELNFNPKKLLKILFEF